MNENGVKSWINKINISNKLSVKPIKIGMCEGWQRNNGEIVHKTGHFFKIKGVSVKSVYTDWNNNQYIFIDQPEVGILSIIIRSTQTGIIEWLLQAKSEPGTVNGTQIAPTVQATMSNYLQIHKGQETFYLNTVLSDKNVVSDAPHSEQGTRFLWKFNRNKVIALDKDCQATGLLADHFKWVNSQDLRDLLGQDYFINTDARSVIATTDWAFLTTKGESLFRSNCMKQSYAFRPNNDCIRLLDRFKKKRKLRWDFVPLNQMEGFGLDEYGVFNKVDQRRHLGFYNINCFNREVNSWCQPLIIDEVLKESILLMRIHKGRAEFWIRLSWEVGFGNRTEFGPSYQSVVNDNLDIDSILSDTKSTELVSIKQSDEGSRFNDVIMNYRVVLVSSQQIAKKPKLGVIGIWVTLSILQMLCYRAGTVNNELRTIVSLLLSNSMDQATEGL